MIVPQKMKETMKGENAQLGLIRVPRLAGLPAGNASGDNDIPQQSWPVAGGPWFVKCAIVIRSERQHVGDGVLGAILPVELADLSVGDQRDGRFAAQADR